MSTKVAEEHAKLIADERQRRHDDEVNAVDRVFHFIVAHAKQEFLPDFYVEFTSYVNIYNGEAYTCEDEERKTERDEDVRKCIVCTIKRERRILVWKKWATLEDDLLRKAIAEGYDVEIDEDETRSDEPSLSSWLQSYLLPMVRLHATPPARRMHWTCPIMVVPVVGDDE